jgi:MFS family permease
MVSRASGVSAESHPVKSVASATSHHVAESPGVPTVAPFEGFQFIQNLATQTSGRRASHESVGAWGVAALCGTAATTATVTAWVKSRTKPERDLPKGTHVRAAVTAFKALGVASAFTGVASAAVFAGAWGLGIDSADSLRRSLRGATRGAIAATGAETIRRTH